LMLVIDRNGVIRYSGGYSRRKQGELEDETILRHVRGGADIETLPIYGCAVSAELARLIDPLRLGSIVQAGK
jgi:hypothetical protein